MNEFEAKAAAVLADPAYEKGLRRDAEIVENEQRRQRSARLRQLATVAVAAMNGEHGEQAQTFTNDAMTKSGDVRPEVSALARWDVAHRKAEPPMDLDRPLLRRALENPAVETALRAVQALAREAEKAKAKR